MPDPAPGSTGGKLRHKAYQTQTSAQWLLIAHERRILVACLGVFDRGRVSPLTCRNQSSLQCQFPGMVRGRGRSWRCVSRFRESVTYYRQASMNRGDEPLH